MNIMSAGLTCPFCKDCWCFGSEQAAAIRLYAMCIVCLSEKKIRFNTKTIQKNREIWLKMEQKSVFGDNYEIFVG